MVCHTLATDGPELFQQVGGRDDRWSSIKDVATTAMNIGPATRLIQLFQDRDPIAFDPQTNGGSQAAKTATNHHSVWLCGDSDRTLHVSIVSVSFS